MECEHLGYVFTVPDEWWLACNMPSFVARAAAYRAGVAENRHWRDRQVRTVPLIELAPVWREKTSHGAFNNLPNKSAEQRVCEIFRGFQAGDAIPPVEILPSDAGAAQPFRLNNGCHRFYCSIAAGFTHIPTIDVS
jgi:hypothetical protein